MCRQVKCAKRISYTYIRILYVFSKYRLARRARSEKWRRSKSTYECTGRFVEFQISDRNCFVDGSKLFYRQSTTARKPPPSADRRGDGTHRSVAASVLREFHPTCVGRVENRFNVYRRWIIFYSVDCVSYVFFNLVFKMQL